MEIFGRRVISIVDYNLGEYPKTSTVYCDPRYKGKLFTNSEFEEFNLLLTVDDLENHKRICEDVKNIEPYINFDTLKKCRVFTTEPRTLPVGINYNLNKYVWSELWKF